MGLPAVEDGFGSSFSRASLVGCHLQVKPSQTHLFFGSAIELKVSLLNDEDVVQQMTQGINVSITTEDGKVWRIASRLNSTVQQQQQQQSRRRHSPYNTHTHTNGCLKKLLCVRFVSSGPVPWFLVPDFEPLFVEVFACRSSSGLAPVLGS